MKRAVAIWQALRLIGFPAKDIFFSLDNLRRGQVELRHPKLVCFKIAEWPEQLWREEEFEWAYLAAVEWLKTATLEELTALWEEFQPDTAALVAQIVDAGIEIPDVAPIVMARLEAPISLDQFRKKKAKK